MPKIYLIAVFVLSLAVSLWFNFVSAHINNAGVADASEYMRDAIALGHFLSHEPAFYFSGAPELKQALAELKGFSQAGIVFPGYILLSWWLSASPLSYQSWQAPVFGQCFLCAAASVFSMLTANLLWGRKAGIICGVLSALYPAYIVNSGRLYSESFAASITAVILYSLCRGFAGKRRGMVEMFFLGANLAMVQLTRSLMVVVSAVAFPLTYLQEGRRQSWQKLLFLFLGMAFILAPWICMQKAVFGKASLIVDRVGNYNLYVGTNPSIKGWLSYPYPDVTSIEKKSSFAVLFDNILTGPVKFLKLMADKPYRLFKFPWNDFRTSIGFVSFYWQVVFHEILIFLSALGLALCIFSASVNGSDDKSIVRARLFLLVYLLFHLLYWLFITVPRYNMTAIPALLLFAGAGLAALIDLVHVDRKRGLGLLVSCSVLLLVVRLNELGVFLQVFGNANVACVCLCMIKLVSSILFFFLLYKWSGLSEKPLHYRAALLSVAIPVCLAVAYPARANGRMFEWHTDLKKGQKATQEIVVGKVDSLKGRQVFLLLDIEGASSLMEKGSIAVNGIALDGPLIPGISLTQDFAAVKKDPAANTLYLECEWIYDCMTEPAGISNADLRQWFWVPLPPSVVHSIMDSGKAEVCVENKRNSAVRIFGTYLPKKRSAVVGSLDSSSWEKSFYGVESDRTLSDPRYDLSVDFTNRSKASFTNSAGAACSDLSESAGVQSGSYSVLLIAAAKPGLMAKPQLSPVLPEKMPVVSNLPKRFSLSVRTDSPPEQSEVWMIRLKGFSRSAQKGVFVVPVIHVAVEEKGGKIVAFPGRWMPRNLPAEAELQSFDYCFPLMPSLLPGKIARLNISFEGRQKAGILDIENLVLEIVPLPLNPLVHRSSIF